MTTTLLDRPIPSLTPGADAPTCVHHWLLPPPNGPTIPAACRKCGAQRLFEAAPAAPTGWDR